MSEEATEDAAENATENSVEAFEERLAAAREALEAAETEADLDDVEATLDEIAADVEAADLPEPEDGEDGEDDEATDPAEALESELSDLREELEAQRGPYAEDVADDVEAAAETVRSTEWTEQGEGEVGEVVSEFASRIEAILEVSLPGEDREGLEALEPTIEAAAETLEAAAAEIAAADLDPDGDAETVAALVEAAEELETGLDEAEEWDDLTVREQLQAQGFYEVLDHHKDYPPEWSAMKVWEQRGRTDMILLAFDSFESDFMEEHCFEALARLADPAATDTMLELAEKRNKDAIRVLGKIGAEEALETILEYVDNDNDPLLQKATLRAVGEIGSAEATQAVADKLVAENPEIRSHAARSLGMLGDTRAIDPLADILADDEEDTVRASAAWALNQIGTEHAREAVAEYADDRAYLVQAEAEKAV